MAAAPRGMRQRLGETEGGDTSGGLAGDGALEAATPKPCGDGGAADAPLAVVVRELARAGSELDERPTRSQTRLTRSQRQALSSQGIEEMYERKRCGAPPSSIVGGGGSHGGGSVGGAGAAGA